MQEPLNAQLRHCLDTVANPRGHASTRRVVNKALAEERTALRPLPLAPFRSVLKLERRISRESMVSVGGNFYSVPDATRRRVMEVHTLADEIRIFEDSVLIATHPVLDCRHKRHVVAGHRIAQGRQRRSGPKIEEIVLHGSGDRVVQRPLTFYDAGSGATAGEQRP